MYVYGRILYEVALHLLHTRTTDTRWLNPEFFVAQIQIQIPIPNKYLGLEYKGSFFCRNKWLINGKHEQGIHSSPNSQYQNECW